MNDALRDLVDNTVELRDLLSAHLHKPDKVFIFEDTVKKCIVNGYITFVATWSWWAFFAGFWYFIYRRMYKIGFIILGVSMFIPGAALFVPIFCAITAKYFYVKKFYSDLQIAGYGEEAYIKVKDNMVSLGGFNQWVVILFIIMTSLLLIMVIGMFMMIAFMALS